MSHITRVEFRILLHAQLLNVLTPITLLLSHAIFTGPKQLNASNTGSCDLLTKPSQLSSLHICITSFLFSLLAALALHILPLLLVHLHHPRYE